ncbi:hypothetical protein ACJMK2_002525 [Sinanodonta woodiana]|uniref:Uncharacterized protein n=1 Tax=Sinanodonta woodiana TaxID=1069815 RepID=A0ABD3XVI7_SINWO
MRKITSVLLLLVVCDMAFTKNLRKRRSVFTEDEADFQRLLEDIDAGKVDIDDMIRGDSRRIFVPRPWGWRFG